MVQFYELDNGDDENESHGNNEDEPELVLMALDDHLRRGSKFTAKVPPLLDDKTSWFAWEEDILDWNDMTTLDVDKRGPAVKQAITGGVIHLKKLLSDRVRLNSTDWHDYVLETLRPQFIKSKDAVWLWRFMRIFRLSRANTDITVWPAIFRIHWDRLVHSWDDIVPLLADKTWHTY